MFNGKTVYKDWLFVAGQQRKVGNTVLNPMPGGQQPGNPNQGGLPTVPGSGPGGPKPNTGQN